jgi:hypothetical protein
MVNRTYIQQGGGTTVRATAQGAQSIEVEVSASPSYGQGYGGGYGRVYDPMQFAQRTFFTWACIGLAVTAAGVATGHHLVCLFAIPAVFICLRASYDVFRWRNGGVWGLSAFGIWLLSPSDWWPVKAGDDGQEPSAQCQQPCADGLLRPPGRRQGPQCLVPGPTDPAAGLLRGVRHRATRTSRNPAVELRAAGETQLPPAA